MLVSYEKFIVGLLAFFIVVLFVAIKFESLFYPYYWDEAWSYIPAITSMANNNISLMPGCIDPELYAGHPLLYYFIAATWMSVFGSSFVSMHSFSLFVSVVLLFSLFYHTKKLTNNYLNAFVSMLFLASLPIFISQSTFVLVEVFLSLIVLWCCYFFAIKKYTLFYITMVLALWTKETAYVLLPAFFIVESIELYKANFNFKIYVRLIFTYLSLFFMGFLFFILQKVILGWFFIPRHMGLMSFSWTDIWYKILLIKDVLFVHQERVWLSLGVVIIFILGIFRKNNFSKSQLMFLKSFFLIYICFSVFSSVNFFTDRYVILMFPLFAVVLSIFIQRVNTILVTIIYSISIGVFGIVSYFKSSNAFPQDVQISYLDMVKSMKQAANYVEENIKKKYIYGDFLMNYQLSNPACGYITIKENNYTGELYNTEVEYYIFSTIDNPILKNDLIDSDSIVLIKEFKNNNVFVEIYKKINNE